MDNIKNLSAQQVILLGLYKMFESNKIKIEYDKIDRGDKTEIVFTVFDKWGNVLYEDSTYDF